MGTTHLPVYAIERLELYSTWFHYSSADGQPYGWVALLARPNGLSVAYAHLQDRPDKNVYEEGEQIGIISDILNNDHLHFEMDGEVAGDMPAKLGGGDMPLTQHEMDILESIRNAVFGDVPTGETNIYHILKEIRELRKEVAALKLTGGTVDIKALAKAVNDDAAARMKE
jgi:murein DD-endopeptidase MepM/ murein hydrolase activator NlpD